MSGLDFWWDGQLRRYVLQVSAIFTGFKYQSLDSNGNTYLTGVPVMWAAADRQVSAILRNNSENAALSVPKISIWVSGLDIDDDRRRVPTGVDSLQVYERDIDPITNQYTGKPGNRYTVERMMPVPYKMKFQVDIWTSNKLQKDQLLEQILVLFNPSLDIQTSTNPLDWTAITTLRLTSISYSSQTIPIGTSSDEIDIASLDFELPIYINPPAKIKKENIINQIIANIGDMDLAPKLDKGDVPINNLFWSDKDLYSRQIITIGDYCVDVNGKEITLLSKGGTEYDKDGNILNWQKLLEQYGKIRPSVSQLRLKVNNNLDDYSADYVGTFQYHPLKQNVLIWTIDIDTLKPNNLPNITAIVNPSKVSPGFGLPLAVNGQRYLLSGDVTGDIWGVKAYKGDIIEFHSNQWFRTFIAEGNTGSFYVTNNYTGQQLKWDSLQGEFILAIDGIYYPGFWRIFI